ncbi:hypothetical protein RFM98_08640 [Mesorhizobium sp. VK9D]|uniref:hypothetical protein n=1 Tax=Mesorhizobium australafricanum TaxID=3072311 RepID=UPI002A2420EE|nr:hypothetical protein [Mesorhizobium sp. VK9D]MDX8452821.1 hypothetical protein [Mesorhizobium sp. VK9D]
MADTSSDSKPVRIEAYYHKSNFFRVIHADGVFGGVTPRAAIHCGFFSERSAIPLRTAFEVINGQPGQEEIIESKPGIVREMEADVVMDLNSALAFHIWMAEKLEVLRKSLGISDEEWEKTVASVGVSK